MTMDPFFYLSGAVSFLLMVFTIMLDPAHSVLFVIVWLVAVAIAFFRRLQA